jgi:hypothetical protein
MAITMLCARLGSERTSEHVRHATKGRARFLKKKNLAPEVGGLRTRPSADQDPQTHRERGTRCHVIVWTRTRTPCVIFTFSLFYNVSTLLLIFVVSYRSIRCKLRIFVIPTYLPCWLKVCCEPDRLSRSML